MSRSQTRIALSALLLLAWAPVNAWSPLSRAHMVDDAIRLMPESLRMALERNREAVRRGALTPMTHEDEAEHRAPWDGGTLDRTVEAEVAELIRILGEPTSFQKVAQQFGRVAHFVLDAGFPPAMSDEDGATRYRHFSEFCESRMEKFPLVFYGHDDGADVVNFRAASLEIMQRAREEDRELGRAYARAGDPPNPSMFDDRSVPFAVGSLSYSHSVTDVVRTWITAWSAGGGDTGRTPYLKKPNLTEQD